MTIYNAGYNFNPNDTVWVLDGQSIKEGICLQTSIVIVADANNNVQTNLTYLVLLNCNVGTIVISDEKAFHTLADAVTALQTYINSLTC